MAIFNISMGSGEADSPTPDCRESRDACRPEDALKRAAGPHSCESNGKSFRNAVGIQDGNYVITVNTWVETRITDRKVAHLGNVEHSYRIKKLLNTHSLYKNV